MNKELNYYEILNINFNSDRSELKNNYRKLSKKYHPDINDGDDTYFKLISEAYKVLTNTELREKYDKHSRYGKNYDSMLELLDFEFSNSNVSGTEVSSKLKDYKKKEMLHIILELIEFKPSLTYTRDIICSNCEGSGNTSIFGEGLRGKYKGEDLGSLFDKEEVKCDICKGSGSFNKRECPGCKGEGYVKLGVSTCQNCGGNGLKEVSKTINIKKDDFDDGKLKVEFHGNQSKYNGKVGNLYIIVENLLPDPDQNQQD